MVGAAGPGGSSRLSFAEAYEDQLSQYLAAVVPAGPFDYQERLIKYLSDLKSDGKTGMLPAVKIVPKHPEYEIVCGAAGNRESKADPGVRLKSGSELRFSLTLQYGGEKSNCGLAVASYRLMIPGHPRCTLIRVEVEASSQTPRTKSRSHAHVYPEALHIPFPAMEPIAVIEKLVYEFDPQLWSVM
jgi:hypothetical protein